MMDEERKAKHKRARSKGVEYVREVRNILLDMGHATEGPGYQVLHIKKNPFDKQTQPLQVHKDYFGIWDLMSYLVESGQYQGHQVSVIGERSRKIRDIQQSNHTGWLWCRDMIKGRVCYRVWWFIKGKIVNEDNAIGELYFTK